jgi:DNA-binding NarL/FixJ family response regulator
MNSMPIRILIADRQFMYREALARLLESTPGFEVAGGTDNGERLAALVRDLKPDVLLLDIKLRKLSGMDALRQISDSQSSVRPLLLTDESRTSEIVRALLCGARGVVKKDTDIQLLFKAIRTVAAGEFWLGHSAIGVLVENLRMLASRIEQNNTHQIGNLSRPQQRIVRAIVEGCTNRQVAQELKISERTVKYHLTHIFRKLGVSGRMELARFTMQNKISRAS